jgi:hypothetical protein
MSRADLERPDLQRHGRVVAHVDEVPDLLAHDGLATDGPAQRALVYDRPQPRRDIPAEDLLPGQAGLRATHDIVCGGGIAKPDERADVAFCLQQPSDELQLVVTESSAKQGIQCCPIPVQ